jgi:pimeloyl-ACP methyl ester carboxylesterase
MRYLIFVFLIFILPGCFSKWVMTEKEIKAYYAHKPVKPTFFTIQNDSVKLFCATTGADTLPPLLLVHGAPGAWYGSRNILDDSLLQSRFHIIAMDRLGYNKSRFRNKKKAVTSIDLQATAILEALRLNKSREKGMVLGSSYGAPIAMEIASRHPEKFYHLFLLAAAVDPDKEKFWWFHKYIRWGPAHWLMPRFLRIATDEKFAHVRELRKLPEVWARLAVPVTVIQGGSDHIIDPSNFEYTKKQLKGKEAEFILIPEAGHLLRFRYSGLVKEEILKAERAGVPGIRYQVSGIR